MAKSEIVIYGRNILIVLIYCHSLAAASYTLLAAVTADFKLSLNHSLSKKQAALKLII